MTIIFTTPNEQPRGRNPGAPIVLANQVAENLLLVSPAVPFHFPSGLIPRYVLAVNSFERG